MTEPWDSEEAHSAWYEAHVLPALPPGAPGHRYTIQRITNVIAGN